MLIDRLFARVFLPILLAALLGLNFKTAPVQAASAAAIRAYDNIDVTSKDFVGKRLQAAEFSDAHLDRADFTRAQMQGVVFDNVTLTDADFKDADLTDGMAYRSDFSKANFENTVLTDAILLKSTFTGAIAKNADFSGAALDKEQIIELCKTAAGVNPVTKADTRESLGCR
ncbi:pentapeptide repeat-containing protein [Lyngbya confervoides]|uniref:Pentapeptide repeat-containing protein n=1 Tax=Lyngbya confervoides BDU141951 TaxID=1574623 RepID=A0ABD4T5S7_9CYAN|nr:pentapeptide repeat-containing protein [Lyngbya confervoides]MCM1984062.1 pentapeptide repeat-containing protein [Lyngbya confervoides BDU141951]